MYTIEKFSKFERDHKIRVLYKMAQSEVSCEEYVREMGWPVMARDELLCRLEREMDISVRDEQFMIRRGDSEAGRGQQIPSVVLLHNIRSAFNVGSIFRTAECLGFEKVYLTGYTPTPEHRAVVKTAMNTDDEMPWEKMELIEAIEGLREQGYQIIALETGESAEDLFSFSFAEKSALVLGNEQFGLSSEVLQLADRVLSVPVFGKKNSLNVGVCFSICGYELRRQWEMK